MLIHPQAGRESPREYIPRLRWGLDCPEQRQKMGRGEGERADTRKHRQGLKEETRRFFLKNSPPTLVERPGPTPSGGELILRNPERTMTKALKIQGSGREIDLAEMKF